jgi:hypothetical protein
MKPTAFGPITWAKNVPPMLRADGRPDDTAHHVLLVLATYAKKDGSGARPSVETLADDAYLTTTRAAADALERIETAGLISKAGVHGGTVVWTLHLHITRSGPTVLDERRDRAREKAAERQRRRRQRLAEEVPRHAPAERDVTPCDSVTDDLGVTLSDSVSHAVRQRESRRGTAFVTPSRPLQEQVRVGVTTNELPLNCQGTTTPAPPVRGSEEDFATFWSTYPRKIAKGAARRAWDKALKAGHNAAEITAGAARFATERAGQDPKYTPHPASWLNAERWGDEPEQPRLRAVSNGYQPWRNPANQDAYDEDLF